MAAPAGITWGAEVNGQGRIGIYTSVSSSSTTTTVKVQVWFWSKWGIEDTNNSYYFDEGASNATTRIGSKNINHTVSSGSGWSTSNQTMLGSNTFTYDRKRGNIGVYYAAKFADIDDVGGTMTVTKSVIIPRLGSYTVSYNANGGSGGPGSQMKTHGTALKLSTTKPTRTGYLFLGWGSSSSTSTVTYAPGASYTTDADIILYAVWKINTYTVSYNANGGSGAPGNQTKIYGTTLKLSSIKPTRTNYAFLGWGTSSTSTTVSYAAGANYISNEAITLYAIWELAYVPPTIRNLRVSRCDFDGVTNETGTSAKVEFGWSCSQNIGLNNVKSMTISYNDVVVEVSASGTSGDISYVVGASGEFNVENTYTIAVTVTDNNADSTTNSVTLPAAKFPMDFKAGGTGVAFGKHATMDGVVDSAWVYIGPDIICEKMNSLPSSNYMAYRRNLTSSDNLNNVIDNGTYINALNANATTANNYPVSEAGKLEVVSGDVGHVYQTYHTYTNNGYFQRCRYTDTWRPWKKIDFYSEQKVLYKGGSFMHGTQTITLSEKISAQRNGIILVFSYYASGANQQYSYNSFFVSKALIKAVPGHGHAFFITEGSNNGKACVKYVYIHDDRLVGYNTNDDASGTIGTGGNLLNVNNNNFVLEFVYGI